MDLFVQLKEAARMLSRSHSQFAEYGGSIETMSHSIIKSCYNKTFFEVSSGHYRAFYARDFGMCIKHLIDLGYIDEVLSTLTYALKRYKHANKITTTIVKSGACVDMFSYGCDSLPFLLRSLIICNNKELLDTYQQFIEEQAQVYADIVYDSKTQLVKKHGHFSSMRDHYVRESACYDNCMVFMLAHDLESLKWKSPFTSEKIKKAIITSFYNGNYFINDLSGDKELTGDAQVFPFYCGVTSDQTQFDSCMNALDDAGLTSPFPLKYAAKRNKKRELFFPSLAAPNFEGTTIWLHLGLCYVDVCKELDFMRYKSALDQYARLMRTYTNFLELYAPDGKPYHTLLYQTDESMLWVSIFYNNYRNAFTDF
ncbi:MAG: hypothetical protein ACI8Y7_000397 [Candidatus Woesearchaeota archaeon]|jgi:hypothetical protein